jgi:hypothetical protein
MRTLKIQKITNLNFNLKILFFLSFQFLLTEISMAQTEDFFNTNQFKSFNDSDVLLPIGSFILPGLGQWTAGQFEYASAYTSIAAGGLLFSANASKDASGNEDQSSSFDTKDTAYRKSLLGLQTFQAAGGFSLYHSFQTAVSLRKKRSRQYEFLSRADTPKELLLAPLQIEFLKRPSTWIPLSIGAIACVWLANHPSDDLQKDSFKKEDAMFTVGFSYNAGTHEEAVFRGWMMPVLRENWMSDAWANGVQASAFAAAHLGTNPIPITQLILGWHLGKVTQNNTWSIQESIFIHTWWDIIAFAAQYHSIPKETSNATPPPPAKLHLPPLVIVF